VPKEFLFCFSLKQSCFEPEKIPNRFAKGDWVRSVANGFSQFSLFLFTLNHISYKELQTSSIQVEVSKPNQKQMLYAICTPKEMKQRIDYLMHITQRLILKCNE